MKFEDNQFYLPISINNPHQLQFQNKIPAIPISNLESKKPQNQIMNLSDQSQQSLQQIVPYEAEQIIQQKVTDGQVFYKIAWKQAKPQQAKWESEELCKLLYPKLVAAFKNQPLAQKIIKINKINITYELKKQQIHKTNAFEAIINKDFQPQINKTKKLFEQGNQHFQQKTKISNPVQTGKRKENNMLIYQQGNKNNWQKQISQTKNEKSFKNDYQVAKNQNQRSQHQIQNMELLFSDLSFEQLFVPNAQTIQKRKKPFEFSQKVQKEAIASVNSKEKDLEFSINSNICLNVGERQNRQLQGLKQGQQQQYRKQISNEIQHFNIQRVGNNQMSIQMMQIPANEVQNGSFQNSLLRPLQYEPYNSLNKDMNSADQENLQENQKKQQQKIFSSSDKINRMDDQKQNQYNHHDKQRSSEYHGKQTQQQQIKQKEKDNHNQQVQKPNQNQANYTYICFEKQQKDGKANRLQHSDSVKNQQSPLSNPNFNWLFHKNKKNCEVPQIIEISDDCSQNNALQNIGKIEKSIQKIKQVLSLGKYQQREPNKRLQQQQQPTQSNLQRSSKGSSNDSQGSNPFSKLCPSKEGPKKNTQEEQEKQQKIKKELEKLSYKIILKQKKKQTVESSQKITTNQESTLKQEKNSEFLISKGKMVEVVDLDDLEYSMVVEKGKKGRKKHKGNEKAVQSEEFMKAAKQGLKVNQDKQGVKVKQDKMEQSKPLATKAQQRFKQWESKHLKNQSQNSEIMKGIQEVKKKIQESRKNQQKATKEKLEREKPFSFYRHDDEDY